MSNTQKIYTEDLILFDLLEDKRSNSYQFFRQGLLTLLKTLKNSLVKSNKKLTLYPEEYFFKFYNRKTSDSFSNDSVNFSLYIPAEIVNNKLKTIKKFNLFICNFPLLFDNNTFWINGIMKTIHQQLTFDPSIFVNIKDSPKLAIYDEKQDKIFTLIFNNANFVQGEDFQNEDSLTNSNNVKTLNFSDSKEKLCGIVSNISSDYNFKNKLPLNKINITYKIRHKLNNKLKIKLPKHVLNLTKLDIIKLKELLSDINNLKKITTDLDDLENKSVKYINEYLTNIVSYQLNKIKLISQRKKSLVFINLIKLNKISLNIDELFSNGDISLPTEQTNPLSEISQQRKLLNLKRQEGNKNISVDIRNIHPSMFGRLCPIDTPEGDSAGLITSLSMVALSNSFGLLETPLFPIKRGKELINKKIKFYESETEDLKIIKFAANNFDYFSNYFKNNIKVEKEFSETTLTKTNFSFLTYLQVFSLACSNIPFLEHNDGNRILMGANMQKQAVPLLFPENSIVSSGIEEIISSSSNIIKSLSTGYVFFLDSTKIIIKTNGGKKLIYFLDKIKPTQNETIINLTNNLWVGEKVSFGQILAQGFSIKNSELALGVNLTVAYMNWDGFNFEDAIIISDRLIKNDKLTSLHTKTILIELEENEVLSYTKNKINQIPGKFDTFLYFGIINKNKYVKQGDILLIKESIINSNKRFLLLESDFEGFISNIELKVPEINNKDESKLHYSKKLLKLELLQIRKINVGDKLSGRFGNKGVISRILPEIDMPFLLDGTPVDILLNPLGIPSRMNVGQIFETLLGMVGTNLNKRYKLLAFDESFGKYASKVLVNQKLKENKIKLKNMPLCIGDNSDKTFVVDGRTGEIIDNPVLVGRTYILKLFHLSQDKVTSRTVGPNSLITNQPVKGKKLKGGQRFGEMEVWALEAYGASYTLYEMLTLKSDDIFMSEKLIKLLEGDLLLDQINYSKMLFVLDLDLKSLGIDFNLTGDNFINDSMVQNNIIDVFKKQVLFESAQQIFKKSYKNYARIQ